MVNTTISENVIEKIWLHLHLQAPDSKKMKQNGHTRLVQLKDASALPLRVLQAHRLVKSGL